MNKKLFMLPLLLTGSVIKPVDKEAKKVERVDPFDDLFNNIRQDMQRFEKRFNAIEQYMFTGFDQLNEQVKKSNEAIQKTQKLIEVAAKDNFVTVKMHLGELKAQDVNIEADGDSLNGRVPLKDGSANFYVQNGVLFGLSMSKHEAKKAEGEQEKKSVVQMAESTKMETLPTYVEKLENTEVSYENGVLTLKMPTVQKKGTKLNVVAK